MAQSHVSDLNKETGCGECDLNALFGMNWFSCETFMKLVWPGPWEGERACSSWHMGGRTSVILHFKIKPGQTLPVRAQYPKAPIKSINSQVIQQLSRPANYIVQITLSCQPPTHVCECVRTHTSTHLLYMAGVTSHYLLCLGSVSLKAPVASS